MKLFRVVVPLILAGVLPCAAQSLLAQQSTNSAPSTKAPFIIQSSPCIMVGGPKSPDQAAILKKKLCAESKRELPSALANGRVEMNSACYAIRDYRFAVPKDSGVPKLKSYSTCVSAARFETRNATEPAQKPGADPSAPLRSGRDDNSK